jgi:O-antigen/teichoic acid export membrane protein
MIAARWAMRLIGLVSTMILARLLAPEDFGLIALALLAYGLLETLSYAGVDLALMRQGNDSREHYDTAWTIQVLQGVFIAVCLAVAAPFVAAYFDEPRAKAVIWWIALRAPIESLQNIGVVAFRKELDFAKEFRFTLISKLLGFVAVVGAALLLRNYWALVVGSIFAAVLNVWLSYRMHPYRPRWSLARFGEIWSFSQWLVISRVGSYLNRKCDEFVVGGHAGTAAMGSCRATRSSCRCAARCSRRWRASAGSPTNTHGRCCPASRAWRRSASSCRSRSRSWRRTSWPWCWAANGPTPHR